MDNLISRQDAIKYFAELWECIGTIGDREEWEDVCNTTVNEIKSAQPEPHWIPCSERLPDKPNMYTVTDLSGKVVRYVFNDNESSRKYWRRCAKAWMPLPEPYQDKQKGKINEII